MGGGGGLRERPAHGFGSGWEGAVDLILRRHGYARSFAPVFAEHNATLFDHLTAEHFEALGQAAPRISEAEKGRTKRGAGFCLRRRVFLLVF